MGLDEVGKLVNEVQKGGLEKWRSAAGGQRLGVQTAPGLRCRSRLQRVGALRGKV